MTQTMPLKIVREQLSELVSKVAYGDQKVVITKFGKPIVALVTYDDYERMINPRKRFSTEEEWGNGFALMDKMRTNTKKFSQKKVKVAISKALKEVRQQKRV